MITAGSLFEAAHRALQSWSLLYWFDPAAIITVQADRPTPLQIFPTKSISVTPSTYVGDAMKLQILKILAMLAPVATSLNAQTNDSQQYDVRHVHWGMSMAEVRQSEPEITERGSCFNDDEPRCWIFGTPISGIDSNIIYKFDTTGLASFQFMPYSTKDSDARDALYAWRHSLVNKYGLGYLFVGDAKIGHPASVTEFDVAVTKFFKTNAKFDVQFHNRETVIDLEAFMDHDINHKLIHFACVLFCRQAPDNF